MTTHEELRQFVTEARANYSRVYNLVNRFEEFLIANKIEYRYDSSKVSRSVYIRVGIDMPAHEEPYLNIRFSDHALPYRDKRKKPYVDFYCGPHWSTDNNSIGMIEQTVLHYQAKKEQK